MLPRAILLIAVLLILNCFPYGGAARRAFQSRDPLPVEAEEYAAYSAFINQKYIPYYSIPMYTLQGKLIEDGELDEKGVVVIAAGTQQEFANIVGVSRYLLQSFLRGETNQEAEETFDDLVGKSEVPARLTNAFNLTMRYELAGNKEEDRDLYKLKWDRDKFLDRFPSSKGLLSFSRVGFDATRSKAVFVLAQLDLNSMRDHHPNETTYLVLLKKEGVQWKVNKIWGAERKSFVINLGRCENFSNYIPLPHGSEGFTVSGRKDDKCVIEHMREIERGYRRTRCHVPVTLGKVIIFESGFESDLFVFSPNLSTYCEKPVRGGILRPH